MGKEWKRKYTGGRKKRKGRIEGMEKEGKERVERGKEEREGGKAHRGRGEVQSVGWRKEEVKRLKVVRVCGRPVAGGVYRWAWNKSTGGCCLPQKTTVTIVPKKMKRTFPLEIKNQISLFSDSVLTLSLSLSTGQGPRMPKNLEELIRFGKRDKRAGVSSALRKTLTRGLQVSV